jgi:O-antigen/teichoic acid export membrane protein
LPTLARIFHPLQVTSGQQGNPGESGERLFALALRLVLVATIGVAIGITPLADRIAVLLFGAEFAAAGDVLTVLIWSAPLYAWETASITRLMAERASRSAVRITLIHLLLLLVLLPVLGWRFSAVGAAAASVIAAAGGALAGFWLLRQWNDRETVSVLLRLAGCALVATAVGAFVPQAIGRLGLLPNRADLWGALVGLLAYALLLISTRLLTGEDLTRLRRAIKA